MSRRKVKRSVSVIGALFWTILIMGVLQLNDIILPSHWFYDICLSIEKRKASPEPVQLLRDGEQPQYEHYTIEKSDYIYPTIGMVELNDESCKANFAVLPLGPQDFAVILSKLSQAGVKSVGVSSPLIWQSETGDMSRAMFCQVMKSFPQSVVGLRGRTAAQPDFTPAELRQSAIPPENISGDARGLPIANRPLPNGLTAVPDSLSVVWAPDWLQDEPLTHKPSAIENMSFPLIMRWNGETIPTLPLRLALMRLGLSSKDVQVKLGESITYGDISLPLDINGRTRLSGAKVQDIKLSELVAGYNVQEHLGDNSCVILEQPATGQNTPQRMERLALTVSQLSPKINITQIPQKRCIGDVVLTEKHIPGGWITMSIATVVLFIILLLLPRLHGLLRWPLVMTIPFFIMNQCWDATAEHQWLPLNTYLFAWLLFIIALIVLKPAKHWLMERHRRYS